MPSLSETTAPDASLNLKGGAWDCHIHVFGAPERYPLRPDRRYTPTQTSLASVMAHAAQMSVGHLVLVQASPYGDDNRCLLDALEQLGAACRGVVSLPPQAIDDPKLAALHAAGVRGVRVNPGPAAPTGEMLRAFRALSARLSGSGWHIEINASGEQAIPLLRATTAGLVPAVFDHMAGLDPAHLNFKARLSQTIELAAQDHIWLKVSGFDRVCRTAEHRLAQEDALMQLMETSSTRLLWGSDWPHTPLDDAAEANGFRSVDDRSERAGLAKVFGERADQVFKENPAKFYG